MTARFFRGLALVVALAFALALVGLTCAHVGIRNERPQLPSHDEVLSLASDRDGPVRLRWVETASQFDGKQRMVYPVFVLEWSDGRLLLVDTGMDADAARAFGRPMEWALGADPVEVGQSIDQALGTARDRVAALVFTHLHADHTQGLERLCAAGQPQLTVYATPGQTERANYTTRPGLAHLDAAACAQRVALADEGLARLPEFPGVAVMRAAGHTPGSQMIAAWVAGHGYLLAGDVVFEIRQVREDLAKPLAYRVLITPEYDGQLADVRRWLAELETRHGWSIVPSHDHANLVGLGIPPFGR